MALENEKKKNVQNYQALQSLKLKTHDVIDTTNKLPSYVNEIVGTLPNVAQHQIFSDYISTIEIATIEITTVVTVIKGNRLEHRTNHRIE